MAQQIELLVVDDERDIRQTISDYFEAYGYVVHAAADGDEMRAHLAAHPVSLVLLDLRMPGEDGFTLCRYLQERHDVGVVMLTGSADTHDKIVGLEMGADDYVAKPFDLRELLARVKSVLRRMQTPAPAPDMPEDEEIAIGPCRLNTQRQSLLTISGETVTLTGKEFGLLMAFIRNPNRVLTRDSLLNLTENRDWDPFDRSIDVRVTRLRKKIEEQPGRPQFIRTVRGSGYLFSPDGQD